MNEQILLVEDDAMLRESLVELLERENYSVSCACSARQARAELSARAADMAILDVTLPDGDGVELCRDWRAEGRTLPVLFLTARDDEMDIVRGLDSGGNDYVTKPFRMLELLSRIRALLRANAPGPLRSGDIELDARFMAVRRAGQPVAVTPTEFRLMQMLLRGAGRIATREMLLRCIWDSEGAFIDDNTLSVHISRLREKVGARHIRTVRGVGYQWVE